MTLKNAGKIIKDCNGGVHYVEIVLDVKGKEY
jgi:hypothetical protein